MPIQSNFGFRWFWTELLKHRRIWRDVLLASLFIQLVGLTSWAVTNALLQYHLSGADDAALGGDLAYWYGKNNGFTGISLAAAQQVIGAQGFGAEAQSLHAFSGLQDGFVKLS